MDLSLNYNGAINGGSALPAGEVFGLYVFGASTDVVSVTWNGDQTVTTGTYNSAIGAWEIPYVGTQIGTGNFTLTYNGVAKNYGYINSGTPGYLGDSSTIIECDSGQVWFNDDNNELNDVWGTDTNTLQVNSGPILQPVALLNGTPTKGRQVIFNLGSGYTSGQTLAFILTVNIPTGTFTVDYNFTIPATLPCPTCSAGDNAPFLSTSNYSNTCPATTFDLGTLVAGNLVSGSVLQFHNSATVSASTLLANNNVGAGTYYGVFYNSANDCYSPTTEVTVTITTCCNLPAPTVSSTNLSNTCPATTVDLSSLSANNPQSDATLKFYTDAGLTTLASNTQNSSGTVYASFESNITAGCKSPSTEITVKITSCIPIPDIGLSYSNECPANTVNLGDIIALNESPDYLLEFHNVANPIDDTTKLSNYYVTAGDYHAVFHSTVNQAIYGQSVQITVLITECIPIKPIISPPVITEADLCKLKCNYQRKITGIADFDGIVALFEAPIDQVALNPIIASGVITGGVWTISSDKVKANGKYIAYGIRLDGIVGGTISIDPKASQVCLTECVLVGVYKGTIGIQKGILVVYDKASGLPVATGVIKDGNWQVFQPLNPEIDYYLQGIELKLKP